MARNHKIIFAYEHVLEGNSFGQSPPYSIYGDPLLLLGWDWVNVYWEDGKGIKAHSVRVESVVRL